MKFIKEKKSLIYNFDVEFSDKEYNYFRDYAFKNCSLIEMGNMLVNWAIIDILKKQIERNKMKSNKNIKKVKKILRKDKNDN